MGRICSSRLAFFNLKVRTAGEGLPVNTLMMPEGKDSVMSPVIFTMHLRQKRSTARILKIQTRHPLGWRNIMRKDNKGVRRVKKKRKRVTDGRTDVGNRARRTHLAGSAPLK